MTSPDRLARSLIPRWQSGAEGTALLAEAGEPVGGGRDVRFSPVKFQGPTPAFYCDRREDQLGEVGRGRGRVGWGAEGGRPLPSVR